MKLSALILCALCASAFIGLAQPALPPAGRQPAGIPHGTNVYQPRNYYLTITAAPADAVIESAMDLNGNFSGGWTAQTNNPIVLQSTDPMAIYPWSRMSFYRARWMQQCNLTWTNLDPHAASVTVIQTSDARPGGHWEQTLPVTNACTLLALDNTPQHFWVNVTTSSGPIGGVPNISQFSNMATLVPRTNPPTISITRTNAP